AMTLISGAVSRRTGLTGRPLVAAAALVVTLAGCDGFGEAITAHTDVVAQAEGRELRVEQAAEMLAANPQLPPDPQVVRALAELWVDYTLLAQAVLDDSTLAAVDMNAFVAEVRDQALIARL